MNRTDKAIADYRDAKNKVCDCAAAWHGWNEPRRDRMTREEIDLYDAVTALLAVGQAMRDAHAEAGR